MKKGIGTMVCLLLALLAFGVLADESPSPFEDSQLRRTVTLPTGKQMYFYAQNDPIWERTRYEIWNMEGRRHTFGGGGCNPTALAMVIAQMIPEEDLPLIAQHTDNGEPIAFCPGTVTTYFCANHEEDEILTLTTPEQYKKLLPLVFGHYACKNNKEERPFRNSGGTSYDLFDSIAAIYGLKVDTTRELDEALAALHAGSEVLFLSGGRNHPFSGGSGHYVVLADADDTYLYLLDPNIVEKYTEDRRRILKLIEGEPGLVQVEQTNEERLCVSYYFIFSRIDENSVQE